MLRIAVIFLLCCAFLNVPAGTQEYALSSVFDPSTRPGSGVPRPRLISPLQEEVSLADKDVLVFRWSPHEGRNMPGRYFVFKLYGGRSLTASSLMFEERLPGNARSLEIDAGMLDTGKVYTWSLRQGFTGSPKSRRSSHSFKVIR